MSLTPENAIRLFGKTPDLKVGETVILNDTEKVEILSDPFLRRGEWCFRVRFSDGDISNAAFGSKMRRLNHNDLVQEMAQ